ncbi:hypothetical protein WNY81_20515, partial [Shewanella frigidimarina]|uniref:hypothetical protein n=1 Tax=Shewanella frigidimarina TaxID=56812 RepID=UPI0031773D92
MHMIPYLLTALVLTPASVQATAYKLTDDNAFWLGGAIGRGHFAETSLDSNQQHFYDSFSSKWEVGYDVYHNFGGFLSYDFANASPDIHLGTIGIRGIGHITESLDWYAKTGMSRVLIGNSANNNDNGLSGMLGLGVEYQLAHALSMKVGVDYYHRLEATPFTSGHLSQFYWGLSYRFGQTAPVAKTPVAKTPVAKTPVAKTPVAKTPVAKTP